MKKNNFIKTLLIIVGLSLSISGFAKDIFQQLMESKISAPYVERNEISGPLVVLSRTAIKLIPNTFSTSQDLVGNITRIINYECDSESAVKEAKEILKLFLKQNNDIEVLIDSRSIGEKYILYGKRNGNSDKYSMLLIWDEEGSNSCDITIIEGGDQDLSLDMEGRKSMFEVLATYDYIYF